MLPLGVGIKPEDAVALDVIVEPVTIVPVAEPALVTLRLVSIVISAAELRSCDTPKTSLVM